MKVLVILLHRVIKTSG